MKPQNLDYKNLKKKLAPYAEKGRNESADFLNWFLEHVYRLDEVAADDAICDTQNDKGVDGIHIDDIGEEIHIFQSKIKLKPKGAIGDVSLKQFYGTLAQFNDEAAIDALTASTASAELKNILKKKNIGELVGRGFKVKGVYICNLDKNADTIAYLKHVRDKIIVYGRSEIVAEYVDVDAPEGVADTFEFHSSPNNRLMLKIQEGVDAILLPAKAKKLIELKGIADTSLFSKNVRYSLGETKVNKDIKRSLLEKTDHKFFPLYHNGITIICGDMKVSSSKIQIKNYRVVNGAQSLTVLLKNSDQLTNALELLVKIVKLGDNEKLANKITINSNNQNAIKPRDLRSNDLIQLRLAKEFLEKWKGKFCFEIKRGQEMETGVLITNEEAGRLLLSFDVKEPWSAHQVYKVFDEKYAAVFGRKEANAARIVFLFVLMGKIKFLLDDLKLKPMARYGLTRFFLLYVLARILETDDRIRAICETPENVLRSTIKKRRFVNGIDKLVSGILVDLNAEVDERGESFDYKDILKSPDRSKELADALMKSFVKDLKRKKIEPLPKMLLT